MSLAPRRLSQHSLKICHGFEREQNVCHTWLICESFADNFVAALVCQKSFARSKGGSVLPHAGVIGTKTDVTIDLMSQDV